MSSFLMPGHNSAFSNASGLICILELLNDRVFVSMLPTVVERLDLDMDFRC